MVRLFLFAAVSCITLCLNGVPAFSQEKAPLPEPGVEFYSSEISNEWGEQTSGDNINQDEASKMETLDLESLEEAPIQPAQNMLQLWDALGVSESQWSAFQDGVSWNSEQNNLAAQLLHTAKRFPLDFIFPWIQSSEKADEMLNGKDVEDEKKDIAFELRAFNRNNRRGAQYHLVGIAEAIQKIALIPELRTRYEMNYLYFVAVKLQSGHKIILISEIIPRAWKQGEKVSYPVSADAFFVKYGQLDKQKDLPQCSYFVASRIAWHPDNPLGNLGMDFGLFDDLDSQPPAKGRKIPMPKDCSLSLRNRECFFQMIYAVGKAKESKLFKQISRQALEKRDDLWSIRDPRGTQLAARQSHPVESLFNDPIAQRGQLFWITGRAKRIIAIPVEDPDVRKRFGIDKYYNIYLFTYDSDDNPLVIITTELPPGVQTGDGPDYSVELSMPCFMFNTWMYSHQPNAKGKTYQLAPLLIAPKALKYDAAPVQSNHTISNAILLAMALIIAWFFARTWLNAPKKTERKKEDFHFEPQEQPDSPFDFHLNEK